MTAPVEVEAKIILDGCEMLRAIEDRLKALGAVFQGERRESDVYYQHPCRDFAETDEALRIRYDGARYIVTYKSARIGGSGVKARREINLRVDDGKAAMEMLESLGFKPVARIEKKRRYYRLGENLITLDEVEGLGCFVEIEYVGGSGITEAERAIEDAIKQLGLEGMRRTTLSYLELLLSRGSARE